MVLLFDIVASPPGRSPKVPSSSRSDLKSWPDVFWCFFVSGKSMKFTSWDILDLRWKTHLHHWFLRFQRTSWDTVLIWCYQVGSNLFKKKNIDLGTTSEGAPSQIENMRCNRHPLHDATFGARFCSNSCPCCRKHPSRMWKVVKNVDDNSTSKNQNLEKACTHNIKLSIYILYLYIYI